jgi:HK97 family phage major capsid protein
MEKKHNTKNIIHDSTRSEEPQFQGWCSRAAVVEKTQINETERSIRNIIATEQPAVVIDWENWEYVREILLMDGAIIPTNRQVVLLDSHSRYSTASVKGSTREIKMVDGFENLGRVLVGKSYFASDSVREWNLVKEGHLTDTSIGYRTFEAFTVRIPPDGRAVVNGKEYVNSNSEGMTLLIRTKWELKENSLVPIGADNEAKMRAEAERALQNKHPAASVQLSLDNIEEDVKRANEQLKDKNLQISISNIRGNKMTDEEARQLKEENERISAELNKLKAAKPELTEEQRKAEAVRQASINKIRDDFKDKVSGVNIVAEAERFCNEGKSEAEFSHFVITKMSAKAAANPSETVIDIPESDKKKYNLGKVYRALANKSLETLGVEREVSVELSKRRTGPDNGGILIPTNMFKTQRRSLGKQLQSRAEMSVGSLASGGYTVDEQHIAEIDLIELLRERQMLLALGAQYLPNCVGNIKVKRITDKTQAYWVGEGGTPTASKLQFAKEELKPKIVGARTSNTYLLGQQSSDIDEVMITNDIMLGLMEEINLQSFEGTGTEYKPLGLLNLTGPHGIVGTGFTRSKAIEMMSNIRTAFADIGSMSWVTNPVVAGVLADRKVDEGSGVFLINDQMQMRGKPVFETTQCPDDTLVYGAFSNIYVADWGYINLLANPYGDEFGSGGVEYRALYAVDFFFRYPQGFSIATGVN